MCRWLIIKYLLLDVFVPIVDKVCDAFLIHHYYANGDYGWMSGTIFAIALPGFLEFLYWLHYLFCGIKPSKLKAMLVFLLSVTFPFGTIILNLFIVCKGENEIRRRYPMSMVLKALQAFTETPFQLLLQAHILMTTWTGIANNYIQVARASFSLVVLAKTSVEHHFFEVNAKEREYSFSATWVTLLIYLLHVGFRTFAVAILSSYLKFWTLVPIVVFCLANFCLTRLLKTDWAKMAWTTFGSVASPICFVSKGDVKTYMNDPAGNFHKFYVANASLFSVTAIFTVIVLNVVLAFDYLSYTCDNLPFLSCSTVAGCRRSCEPDAINNPHAAFHVFGSLLVTGAAILHLMLVSFQNRIIPSLAQSDHSFLDRL